jgi:ferrous iron transport protein B
MSCSARLPVYTVLIAAFIPELHLIRPVSIGDYQVFALTLQGVVMFAMYLVGIIAAVMVAFLLRRTILRGETPPFVMELPVYKWPSGRIVLHRMLDRGWAFVRRAGTLILAVMILVWAAAYFPRSENSIEPAVSERKAAVEAQLATAGIDAARTASLEAELAEIEDHIKGAHLRDSYLGRAGHWIEPVVRPLGWDWRIGCAAIASFPAREVVVGTLGVLYDLGEEQDEESESLREKLQSATWDGTDEPVYNVPVALSLMVFFALCAQCAATLAVVKRETNSWYWPAFTFTYMTALAYVAAMATYQIGMMAR